MAEIIHTIQSIIFDEKKASFQICLEKTEFRISYEDYISLNLSVGDKITDKDLRILEHKHLLNQAYSVSVRFISYRLRSKKEVRDRLIKNRYSEAVILETIHNLEKNGYLNDELFAQTFTEEKLHLNHWSLNKIKYELYRKGISDEIIVSIYDNCLDHADYDNALKMTENKISFWKEKYQNSYQLKNKIYQYLSSKGYQYSTIQDIFDHYQL